MAVEKISYSFRWKIENYSSCYGEGWNICLRSPVFTPTNFGGSKWYLKFQPSLRLGEPSEHLVFCYLCRSDADSGDEEISVALLIEFIGESGNVIYTRGSSSFMRVFKKGKCSGWYAFPCEQITQDSLTWKEDILTIHCQMFTMQEQSSCVARTKVEVDRTNFTWQITLPDYNSFMINRTFSLSETLFGISATDSNDFIEIRVRQLEDKLSFSTFLNGRISLLNYKGKKILRQNDQHLFRFGAEIDEWVFPNFITKRTIKSDKTYLANEMTFSLFCEFSAPNGSISSDILSINDHNSHKLSNLLAVQDDFVKMFANIEHSDVELRAENTSFPAHKVVLAARSPVFRAMFHQNMIEKETNVVEISDVDPQILKSFLEFVYSGSVDIIDDDTALELMMIADKYQVLSLIETCSTFILSALALENVCKIVYLSDLMNLKLLKEMAVDFVAKNFSDVFKSEEWEEYIDRNPIIVSEILSHLAADFTIVPKKK